MADIHTMKPDDVVGVIEVRARQNSRTNSTPSSHISGSVFWTETFLLDKSIIPQMLAAIVDLEQNAKEFTAPSHGCTVTKEEVTTLLYIGRRKQFTPRPSDPDKLWARESGLAPCMTSPLNAPANFKPEAIIQVMETFDDRAREETAQRRAAELERAVQEATVAQAPVKVMKPLGLGGGR